MDLHTIEIIASVLLGVAVVHTFSVKRFAHLSLKFKEGSVGENFFHLLSEVEIVFGLWAGVLVGLWALFLSSTEAIGYVERLNFTEPIFVFVIMTVASTRPVLSFAHFFISAFSKMLPLRKGLSFYFVTLTLGPLLGSFITEPAAMTVTALILKESYFQRGMSQKFMYLTLGVLFVNVSIGGVLTHFAAPPVLMVAGIWQWDTPYMLAHFGWKAAIAVLINSSVFTLFFRTELFAIRALNIKKSVSPIWLMAVHLVFLCLIVVNAHHMAIFCGLFLFFLGIATITKEYQEELKLRESLLVGFFLGGIVVLGGLQRWWISPLISSLDAPSLFLGATLLTSITDNAALTYLGAQVPNLSHALKYSLVSGAIAGGGLTVIANAPNPAGFSILRSSFGEEGISPLLLFASALVPTVIAMSCFWWL